MTNENTNASTPIVSDLKALFDAARTVHEPGVQLLQRGSTEEVSVLIIPNGMNAVDCKPFLESQRRFPSRPTGTSVHQTLASIIAHANQHKGPGSAAWCSIEGAAASLVVVYDYHLNNSDKSEANGLDADDENGARWCSFGASYAFPISPEFAAWKALAGKAMSQAEMAAFLEDHLHEVCATGEEGERATKLAESLGLNLASASTLLGFARRSAATVNLFVSEKRDPNTGAVELIYQEEVNHQTEDRAKLTPPGVFAIRVPVLQGGTEYRLAVRLRSTVKGRGVTWSFEVFRVDNALTLAVEEELARLSEATGLFVYRGKYTTKAA